MVGKKGAKKKVVEMWGVGVEDVMSSHGLTTLSVVASRPAPPPQCLLNSGFLLVQMPSVPIPVPGVYVPTLSLGCAYYVQPTKMKVHNGCYKH